MRKIEISALIAGATLVNFGVASPGQGAVVFFTDETSWLAAATNVETFPFTDSNVATSDEVGAAPTSLDLLSNPLAFQASNTGLSRSFEVEATMQANFQFGWPPGVGDTLGMGIAGAGADQQDDWEVRLTSGPDLTAFAFDLVSSNDTTGESFSIFGAGNVLLGTLGAAGIPVSADGNAVQFLGLVSDQPVIRMTFVDDDVADNIAVGTFRFAEAAVPLPAALPLFLSALAGLGLMRWRRRAGA